MNHTAYRNAYRAGFAVFAVLLVHAAVFYKERMVMPDASFYLFSIIQHNGFAVMHNRFVCMAPEVFPLIGLKLGAPLSVLAMVYSLAFPVYYMGCYILCGWVFRNHRMAIVLLLYLILISTHTQYWMLSELSLGAALLAVLLAGITGGVKWRGARLWLFLTFAGPLIVAIGFAHPLLVFAVIFSAIFSGIASPGSRRAMLLCAIAYAGVLLVKSVWFKESYEAGAMQGLDHFKHLFPDYFTLHSNKRFLLNCLGKWWSIPVCSAAVVVIYLRSRQWARLLLFCSFMAGYVLLINVCYPDANTLELYVENFTSCSASSWRCRLCMT